MVTFGSSLSSLVLFVICFLLFAVNVSLAADDFKILKDTDLYGNDYSLLKRDSSLKSMDLEGCVEACRNDRKCEAFTYNQRVRACLLKAKAGTPSKFRGAVSGIRLPAAAQTQPAASRVTNDFRIFNDTDLYGGDYRSPSNDRSLKGADLDDCLEACRRDDRCGAFTYNQRARWCFLKTGAGEPSRFKGAISGIRSDPTSVSHAATSTACFSADNISGGLAATAVVDVSVPDGGEVRAGAALDVTWKLRPPKVPDCLTPLYLMFSMPERVRFAGDGFLVLAPGADGPFDIGHDKQHMRVFIPMRRGGEGSLTLRVYQAGPFKLSWAVIEIPKFDTLSKQPDAFDEGNEVLHREQSFERSFAVVPGVPSIAVRDRFNVSSPVKVIVSRSREFVLQVFDGFYRVLENESQALVIERDGIRPNFSPSSRFVVAFVHGHHSAELVDLYTGRVERELGSRDVSSAATNVVVAWSLNDSVLVTGQAGYGAAEVLSPLIDRRGIEIFLGGLGMDAWNNLALHLSLENAVVHFGPAGSDDGAALCVDERSDDDYGSLASLLSGKGSDPDVPVSDQTVVSQCFDIRVDNDWNLGGDLLVSHTLDLDDFDNDWVRETAASQAQYFFQHNEVEPREIAAVALPDTAAIRGRPIRGAFVAPASGVDPAGPPRGIEENLEGLGVHVSRSFALQHMSATAPDGAEVDWDMWRSTVAAWRDEVAASFPGIREHVLDEKEFYACNFGERSSSIDLNSVDSIWHWMHGAAAFWLIQSHSAVMNSGNSFCGQLLLIEADRDGVVSVRDIGKAARKLSRSDDPEYHPADPPLGLAEPGLATVSVSVNGYLAVVGRNRNFVLYDIAKRAPIVLMDELPGGNVVEELAFSEDGNTILFKKRHGAFALFDVASATELLNGKFIDDEFIAYSDQGYYVSSHHGSRFVFVKFPGMSGYFPFYAYRKALERPDVVLDIISARGGAYPAPVLNPPPVVTLTARKSDEFATDGMLLLNVTMNSAVGLAKLRIFADGRMIDELPVSGNRQMLDRAVTVQPEVRWITLQGVDLNGVESVPQGFAITRDQHASGSAGRLYVVAVGTDSYHDGQLPRLQHALADAAAFARTAEASLDAYYGKVQTTVLLDQPHLKTELIGQIRRLVTKALPTDTIMLFIAGHGLRDVDGRFYLATRETDLDRLAQTALAWPSIGNELKRTKARVLVFLDTCHSGTIDQLATNDEAISELVSREHSLAVVAASKGRQFSLEGAAFGGGAFTTALTEIMSDRDGRFDVNGNGVLELSEIYAPLKRLVVQKTSGKQTPWIAQNVMVGEVPVF